MAISKEPDSVEVIVLSDKAAKHMLKLLNNPPKPCEKLLKARLRYVKEIKGSGNPSALNNNK